jgi:hypothetical protein
MRCKACNNLLKDIDDIELCSDCYKWSKCSDVEVNHYENLERDLRNLQEKDKGDSTT